MDRSASPQGDVSRRTFLVGLGRFAVAANLAGSLPFTAGCDDAQGPSSQSAWSDLARRVSGSVLRPEDPFFGDVCRPNNRRYEADLPMGIARCVTSDDVRACIAWVKQHGIPFAVRSGGHNYAGYSTTSGLLIDMTLMAGAELLPGPDGLVRVLGGSINSLLYKQLERMGRTITHGRCDSVGAAGFLLGGGIGFDMRKYGMASDLLRGTELVTADAQVLRANAGENADLFWACRGGGGGNFGVNTAFTLQTFPAESITVFKLTWTRDLPRVLRLLLTELASAPDDFGSKINVTMPSLQGRAAGTPIALSILGQLHASPVPLREIFQSTWEMADTRHVQEDIPFWTGQDFLAETTYPYYYQEKSSYMHAATITDEVVEAMFDWADRMPGTSMPSAFKFFHVGGAVNRLSPTETAYVHRGFDWLFSLEANWWRPTDSTERIAASLDWQGKFYDDVNQRAKASGAFLNFPDPSLQDWQRRYYGDNYQKLTAVKGIVDPDMLFDFPQAVRPA